MQRLTPTAPDVRRDRARLGPGRRKARSLGENEPLLASLRVLDLCDGEADIVTRLLADLGADVLKVEPPAGSPGRSALPALGGVSIPFALHNANKRGIVLDPDDETDRRRLVELAAGADIVVDSGLPGRAAAYGIPCDQLADRFGHLVAMLVTDFGSTGPYASWHATEPVLYAMSSALSRSGPTVGTPVLPPEGIPSATAAVQAAWVLLIAYFNRLRCGAGDYIDFSRFDAVVMALDPPFGTQGQAATARKSGERWRGRPRNQDLYPIFKCRDGFVRICVMSPRQWHGLRAWLGEPEQFRDPRFDVLATRVGQMNAHLIRLDALGKRLTEMAGLSKGEFHFDSAPPVGGVDAAGQPASMPILTDMLDHLSEQLADRERQLGALENLILTRELRREVYPQGRPVQSGFISSFFGERVDPFTGYTSFHPGVDFAGEAGAQVQSVATGVVTWAGDKNGYGNLVEINHGNGLVTRYGHNSEVLVHVGETVQKGQALALIGSTGHSTGPHVHFEVLRDGNPVDPMAFINQNAAPLLAKSR